MHAKELGSAPEAEGARSAAAASFFGDGCCVSEVELFAQLSHGGFPGAPLTRFTPTNSASLLL